MRHRVLVSVLRALFIASITIAPGCGRQEAVEPTLQQDNPVWKPTGEAATPNAGFDSLIGGTPGPAADPTSQAGRPGGGERGADGQAKTVTPVPVPQPSPTAAGPAPVGSPTPVAKRLTGPRSVPPSPRYEPLPLKPDIALDRAIRAFLGAEVAGYGVVVKRLADGRGAQINPDRQFYAASLYKLLVMYEVFKQRGLGLLSFDDELTFTPPYLEYQLFAPPWPLWSKVPIQELLEAMITESDNVAAMLLHDKTGGWNIIQDLKAIGLAHTDIAGDDLPTSARDMAVLLEMIARGKAVDQQSSREMVDLLSRQTVRDRLPALLPEGTTVANKTGNWENATHDVGIVYAPKGAYVIAVLSDRAWESKPIAEVSRLVYEHFEEDGEPAE